MVSGFEVEDLDGSVSGLTRRFKLTQVVVPVAILILGEIAEV